MRRPIEDLVKAVNILGDDGVELIKCFTTQACRLIVIGKIVYAEFAATGASVSTSPI
jgi:hypothetical protein